MNTIKRYYLLETIYSFGLSFTKTTFVLYFLDFNLTKLQIGMIFSIFNLTVIIFEPLTAIFAERFGKKASILLGLMFKVIAGLIFFIGSNFYYFIIAEVISAMALTFISGSYMAWIVDEIGEKRSSLNLYEIFAKVKKYKYTALILGGFLGNQLGGINLSFPWLANSVTFLILLIISFYMLSDFKIEKKHHAIRGLLNGYSLLKDRCISTLLFSSFLTSFALASIKLFWLPTIKTNFDTSITFLGWMWVGIASAHLVGASLVKKFVGFFEFKLEAPIITTVFSTLFLFAMVLTLNSYWTIMFYFLFELGKPLYSSVKSDLINNQIEEQGRVTVLSLHSLSMKLGTSLGLLFIGYMSDKFGQTDAWLLSCAILFLNLFLYISVQSWMKGDKEKLFFLKVIRD